MAAAATTDWRAYSREVAATVQRALARHVITSNALAQSAERNAEAALGEARGVRGAWTRQIASVRAATAIDNAARARELAHEARVHVGAARAELGKLGTTQPSAAETATFDAAIASVLANAQRAEEHARAATASADRARADLATWRAPSESSSDESTPESESGGGAGPAVATSVVEDEAWLHRVADLPLDTHAWHYMGFDTVRGVPIPSNVELWCPDRPGVTLMSPGRGTGWLGSAIYAYTSTGSVPPVAPFPHQASNLYVLEPPALRRVLSGGGGTSGGPWYFAVFDEGGDDRVGTLVRGTAAWLLQRGRCSLFGALWAALPGHLAARSAEAAYRWWTGARVVQLLRDLVGADNTELLDEARAAQLDAYVAARWVAVFLASRLPAINRELVLHAADEAARAVVAEAVFSTARLPPDAPLALTQPLTFFMLRLRIAGILATPGGAWANPGTGSVLYNYADALARMRLHTRYRLPAEGAAAAAVDEAPRAAKRSAAEAALADSRALAAAFVSLTA